VTCELLEGWDLITFGLSEATQCGCSFGLGICGGTAEVLFAKKVRQRMGGRGRGRFALASSLIYLSLLWQKWFLTAGLLHLGCHLW
jgi:hypothetical protein